MGKKYSRVKGHIRRTSSKSSGENSRGSYGSIKTGNIRVGW